MLRQHVQRNGRALDSFEVFTRHLEERLGNGLEGRVVGELLFEGQLADNQVSPPTVKRRSGNRTSRLSSTGVSFGFFMTHPS
ncbi:hypothetical protein P4123_24925 [Pseudomonas aeruginosa]|nr:hypothetical protein [Pseudomonas aeruginosa]